MLHCFSLRCIKLVHSLDKVRVRKALRGSDLGQLILSSRGCTISHLERTKPPATLAFLPCKVFDLCHHDTLKQKSMYEGSGHPQQSAFGNAPLFVPHPFVSDETALQKDAFHNESLAHRVLYLYCRNKEMDFTRGLICRLPPGLLHH